MTKINQSQKYGLINRSKLYTLSINKPCHNIIAISFHNAASSALATANNFANDSSRFCGLRSRLQLEHALQRVRIHHANTILASPVSVHVSLTCVYRMIPAIPHPNWSNIEGMVENILTNI